MARRFLTPINLTQNEIQNPRAQNLSSAPSSPVEGQFYWDTVTKALTLWDGTAWVGAGSAPDATTSIKGIVKLAGDLAGTSALPVVAAGAIDNSKIAAGAAIALSKLATDPLARANHTGTQLANTVSNFDTQVRTSRLDQMAVPTVDVSMNTHKITGVVDPSSAQDAATKAYVDAVKTGLDVKDSVRAATTAAITLSGTQTIDGVAVVAADRVLVKDQASAPTNGIYVVAAGAWSRATDADTSAEVTAGMYTFVTEGTVNGDAGFILTTNDPIVLATDALVFTQFSGAGQITAGLGLAKSGNTLDVNVDSSSIEINADILRVKAVGITNAMLAGSIDLTTKVTGALPVANGGTASTTAAAARTALGTPGRYAANIGDGSTTAITVTHSLGTDDTVVSVREVATPYNFVDCDIKRVDTNTITATFAVAPASAEFRVTVVG